MKNNYSYIGKTIFVGIDVHKKTYSVSVVCEDELVKRDTLPALPEKLAIYLKKYFEGAIIKSAYEAGFSGLGLHRCLIANGIQNIVVNPASIEIGARDRVKNDKRDSLKIAVQLAAKRLKGIFIITPEMEDRRELTRLRSTFVKDRNRMATRLKLKALYHSLIGPEDCKKMSSKWIEMIKGKEMLPGLKYTMNALMLEWESLNKKIKEIEIQLENPTNGQNEIEDVYESVPGIGKTSARILANELGDMSQFHSEAALFSYTGLTPSEYSSGEYIRKGHISRQGKPILRSTLVQCAWVAVRFDESLGKIYDQLLTRAGSKKAIVAIARRLIGRARACFRKNEKYKPQAPKEKTLVALNY